MKVRLVNSAVMPQPGVYRAERITKDEFCHLVKWSHQRGILVSYIGYQQNIELIKRWTGVEVELNRGMTELEDGDLMLVMKLKYRVADPSKKGEQVSESDFEFMTVRYQAL